MLKTIIDIFEAILNDTNFLRRVETELIKTDSAYRFLSNRIQHIKNRIYDIGADDKDCNFTFLFSKG